MMFEELAIHGLQNDLARLASRIDKMEQGLSDRVDRLGRRLDRERTEMQTYVDCVEAGLVTRTKGLSDRIDGVVDGHARNSARATVSHGGFSFPWRNRNALRAGWNEFAFACWLCAVEVTARQAYRMARPEFK